MLCFFIMKNNKRKKEIEDLIQESHLENQEEEYKGHLKISRRKFHLRKMSKERRERVETRWLREIKIKFMEKDDLFQAAMNTYNEWNNTSYTTEFVTQEFLDRITVNYIRHELTSYDQKIGIFLSKFQRKQKRPPEEECSAFTRRVFMTIAETYPFLKEECERQIEAKEW